MKAYPSLLLASMFPGLAASAAAQCEVQELHASPVAAGEAYGTAVAIDGDYALVGAPAAERVDVYVQTAGSWVRMAELRPASGQEGKFGATVAIAGTTAVVGAPAYSDGSGGPPRGAATVFELLPGGWAALDFLSPTTYGFFGQSVAIDPDGILAGAGGDFSDGETYYFDRDPAGTPGDPGDDRWLLTKTFTLPFPPAEHTLFGHAVALEGGTAVISAPGKDDEAYPSNVYGVVLTSDRVGDAWSPLKRVVVSVPIAEEAPVFFGWSVSLSGDRLLSTSTLWGMHRSGTAFLLERDRMGTPDPTDDEWVQKAYFDQRGSNGEPPPDDGFGASCSLDGARFVVGAPSRSSPFPAVVGEVHVFEQVGIGWLRTGRVSACPPTTGTGFGEAVALQGLRILAGEPGDDDLGMDTGSAHAFEFRSAQAQTYVRTLCGDASVLYHSLAPPRIGAAWRTIVDLAGTGATSSLIAVSLTGSSFLCSVNTAYGELAILPPFAVLNLGVGHHELMIPTACPFVGLPFWSQAATLGPTGVRLRNGIFGRIGTF